MRATVPEVRGRSRPRLAPPQRRHLTRPDSDHQASRLRRVRLRTSATVGVGTDRKSTRLNSSHMSISYAVFCLKKKKKKKKWLHSTINRDDSRSRVCLEE